MPYITSKCPICHKIAESEKEFTIGEKTVLLLKCKHIIQKDQIKHSTPEQIVSLDGKKLYNFQNDGVRFIEASGARCLLADEMGLGKTPQAISAVFLHPELQPFLCIVKSSLKAQWQHEIMRWMGEDYFSQIIDSPKVVPLRGMKAYIMSYDILRRFEVSKKKKADMGIDIGEDTEFLRATQETEKEKEEKSKLTELIEKLKIKTIILDECQQIKNSEAQRTKFVRSICKQVDHVIALSGTPIKNSAAEYFPVLNILKPEIFPRYSSFLMHECDSYFTGYGYKTGGLRDPKRFMEKTKSFILRRERKEVLPDLPSIRRSFQFHELSKEVEAAYIQTFKDFRDDYNSNGFGEGEDAFRKEGNILAYFSKMRHLTGLSKINPCIDHVMEIMGSTDDRVTIFVHHKDVAEILIQKLNSLFSELKLPPCARHEAGSSSLETERAFEKARVLVCSTLAGGEGLNLQKIGRAHV